MRYAAFSSLAAILLCVGVARAQATPAQECQSGKNKAAARYASCRAKVEARFAILGDATKRTDGLTRCGIKFATPWLKLEANATAAGSACPSEGDQTVVYTKTTNYSVGIAALVGAARFEDNGDGTVTDHFTGLQWEKKTNLDTTANPADPHDADNYYTLTSTVGGTAQNGTAFTDFLDKLNGGAGPNTCLANQCDWRLPTLEELETILLRPFPCGANPCLDPTLGPVETQAGGYWVVTALQSFPTQAWDVSFAAGFELSNFKTGLAHTRAVRRVSPL